MKLSYQLFFSFLIISNLSFSQNTDSLKNKELDLSEIIITEYRTVNGLGHLPDEKDGIIYAGKKTEIIITDSLDANKAINNTRQILGRTPGLNIVETESG